MEVVVRTWRWWSGHGGGGQDMVVVVRTWRWWSGHGGGGQDMEVVVRTQFLFNFFF
jgi:hypothetical protein